MVAERSARQARVKALTQMRQLTFTAPDQLQSRIKGLPAPQFIAAAKGLRPTRSGDPVTIATKASLASLAHRIGELDDEIAQLDARITPLLGGHAPDSSLSMASASTRQPLSSWPPATIPIGCDRRPPGPTCAVSHPSRPPRAKSPVID